jgi:hypothetical protein
VAPLADGRGDGRGGCGVANYGGHSRARLRPSASARLPDPFVLSPPFHFFVFNLSAPTTARVEKDEDVGSPHTRAGTHALGSAHACSWACTSTGERMHTLVCAHTHQHAARACVHHVRCLTEPQGDQRSTRGHERPCKSARLGRPFLHVACRLALLACDVARCLLMTPSEGLASMTGQRPDVPRHG